MQNQWLPGVFPFWRRHRGKFFLYEKAVKNNKNPPVQTAIAKKHCCFLYKIDKNIWTLK